MKILLSLISLLIMTTVSPAYAVNVPETVSLLKANKAILIDIRNAKDYGQAWISGSVNIPLSFIKTKKWLQGKSLILVNEGFATLELQRTALALQKEGFEIDILDGGLLAWQQGGQPITGDVFAIKELNRIEAGEAVLEKDNSSYLFIDATAGPGSAVNKTFPAAQRLKKPGDLTLAVKAQQSKDSLSAVVLLITDAQPEPQLIKEYSAASPVPVFYLQDGLVGLSEFDKNQQALHKPLAQRIKTVGGCPTCPVPDDTK
jgi:rhodanese-related sulfurtransferase